MLISIIGFAPVDLNSSDMDLALVGELSRPFFKLIKPCDFDSAPGLNALKPLEENEVMLLPLRSTVAALPENPPPRPLTPAPVPDPEPEVFMIPFYEE
ncbi:MAG TPA: hypothetical protein VG965_00005, partial [Patescibacteria group bacterium]|nr:hypothetical protein [Patescibacteria group bacterium]